MPKNHCQFLDYLTTLESEEIEAPARLESWSGENETAVPSVSDSQCFFSSVYLCWLFHGDMAEFIMPHMVRMFLVCFLFFYFFVMT